MSREPGSLITKSPEAVVPWPFDWTAYLAEIGPSVVIDDSSWTVTGRDNALTLTDQGIINGAKGTQVKLAGGTLGVTYRVRNFIDYTGGFSDDAYFDVLITL